MAAELEYRYTGGAANANPDLSLGGTSSSVEVVSVALNNLFDNVLPTDIDTGDHVSYRAFDIHNAGDGSALHVEFFLTDTPNAESIVAVGFDSVGTQSIANDTTAPTGITFTTPLTGSKLALANLAAGSAHRMWIRRTVDQDAININDDTAILQCWFS